jgi:hypothetical protein
MRYFESLGGYYFDIAKYRGELFDKNIIVGGGGLIAKTFHSNMEALAENHKKKTSMIAWGIGESENVDRSGGFVFPFSGRLAAYLDGFDLVGVRDYGTEYEWVPCVSCLHPAFDENYQLEFEIVIYEHKRIPIPIEGGFRRRTNEGNDFESIIKFLGSANTVITNSYHGAYWAILLGKRVLALANMSKMYRMKHAPVICRVEEWKRYVDLAETYPGALDECRSVNLQFYNKVMLELGRAKK